jgi:hypothetical protein
VKRTSRPASASAIALLALGVSSAALADDNIVVRWNTATLQAIRNTRFAPMHAARALAIVHTCIYDGWAAYDAVAVGTRLGAALRRPAGERTLANKQKALSYAAYRALVDLFPTQRTVLFDPQMAGLGYDRSDLSDIAAAVGDEACSAVIAFRHGDGANQLGDLNGGMPYSDYTGYVPINDVDHVFDPNRWQPLRNPDGTVQVFVAPHWGGVTPFALASADQFRPDPPPQYGSLQYEHQVREIVTLSAKLDDRRKAIALYWADGPSTETPPGHWNVFAQFVSQRDRHTLDQDVKLFFVLGNALLDTSIAVWDCKRRYDFIRPISAVRFFYAREPIAAWAGPGRGTQVISGDTFRSYLPTPAFPEYTSGHSAFSAASAQVLRSFTGSDTFGASSTVLAGSSFVEPGVAPSVNVTLTWATFEDAANEAGMSRRYGGIHFKDGDLASRKMGRHIAAAVWNKAETYFNGTASQP